MDENQPDDAAEQPKSELETEVERLRQKRQPVPESASRGRFIGAGIAFAVLVYTLSLFWPAEQPATVHPATETRLAVPPVPAAPPPAVHARQYEEAIGPPIPPIIARKRSPGGPAKIALVIDDCGISKSQTQPVLDLPPTTTLAFLPYGSATRYMATKASEAGHDVMLHMPMQPIGRNDPGPNPIQSGLQPEIIRQRIEEGLASVPEAIGINNHMGSAATIDRDAMQAVMSTLKGHDVFFLDSYTNSRSVAYKVALDAGLKAARRDVFLDDSLTPEAIAFQLERLEQIAHKQGAAIAIGHPHPVTLEALKNWLLTLDGKELQLVRVKDLTVQRSAE